MKKFLFLLLTIISFYSLSTANLETIVQNQISPPQLPEMCSFTIPDGWQQEKSTRIVDPTKILVKTEKDAISLAPSINLVIEKIDMTLPEYTNLIKGLYEYVDDAEWNDLGNINTKAGQARLTMIDMEHKYGPIRIMQLSFVKDGILYLITNTALKNDFQKHYQNFFNAMRSFTIYDDIADIPQNNENRAEVALKNNQAKEIWSTIYQQVKEENPNLTPNAIAEKVFENEQFQEQWKPLQQTFKESTTNIGPVWQSYILERLQKNYLEYR